MLLIIILLLLQKHFNDNKASLKLCLNIAQFKINEEDYEGALSTVETYLQNSDIDINEYSGLVSFVLWLYEKCGKIEKALDVLQTYLDNNIVSLIFYFLSLF